MYSISFGSKFKRDFKTIQKRGYPIDQMEEVFQLLEKEGKLPLKYLPHKLSGKLHSLLGMSYPPRLAFNLGKR